MTPGLLAYIPGAGTFTCVGNPPDPGSVNLVNTGDPGNAPPGTQINAGTQISPANMRGPLGPQGQSGPAGPPGPQGVSGVSVFTTLKLDFVVPVTTGIAFVVDATAFAPGQIVYMPTGNYFSVQSVNQILDTLTLVNQNYPGEQPAGTIIPAGSNVTATGPQGPIGTIGPAGPAGPQGPSGIMPPGVIMAYGAPTAPAGWLPCDGRSVSRTTFAPLFSIISTNYGSADPSSFNLPNLSGRFPLGSSATHALASVGGEENHTLLLAELALHAHAITDRTHNHGDGGHSHTGSTSGHGHTASSPQHNHADPGHQHAVLYNLALAGTFQGGGQANFVTDGNTPTTRVGAGLQPTAVSVVVDAAAALSVQTGGATQGLQLQPAATGITGTNNAGSGTPHNNMPPYQVVNYIIKT
jgi:microcystin-dependent protein